jgi:hypothetical protein
MQVGKIRRPCPWDRTSRSLTGARGTVAFASGSVAGNDGFVPSIDITIG